MPRPHLTLSTELSGPELAELFSDPAVLASLRRLGCGRLTMAMTDLSPARAGVVRTLESAGIAVTAWMLVDAANGYWINADNAPAACARYRELRAWAAAEGLGLGCVGLDVEPPRALSERLKSRRVRALLGAVIARRSPGELAAAERAYRRLVDEIRADGRSVEVYHFPEMADERRAGSYLVRRVLGLVEVAADREVLMLFRSWVGHAGTRVYLPDAQAVVVGVTGGGVNSGLADVEPVIEWEALREELLAASRHVDDVSIFSLEGCVQQGMLPKLEALDWDASPPEPTAWALGRRRLLRALVQWSARQERLLDRCLPPASSGPGVRSGAGGLIPWHNGSVPRAAAGGSMEASEKVALERLQSLVEAHEVCWEVHPIESKPISGERVQVGFEIVLAGAFLDAERASLPVEEKAKIVGDALAAIATDLRASVRSEKEVRVQPFDAGLQASPVRGLRKEARLKLAVLHGDAFHAPVDEHQRAVVDALGARLGVLGAQKGSWRHEE